MNNGENRNDAAKKAEARLDGAWARLDAWDPAGAEALLEGFEPPESHRAETAYIRAVASECAGRFEEAETLYAEAERIDPEGRPRPVRLKDAEVDRLVDEALRSLPPPIREAVADTVIEIVEMPDPKLDRAEGFDPWVLGLYVGVSLDRRSVLEPWSVPDRIRIFKRNLERHFPLAENLKAELTDTLLHEIGHHLGFGEDDLEGMGIG